MAFLRCPRYCLCFTRQRNRTKEAKVASKKGIKSTIEFALIFGSSFALCRIMQLFSQKAKMNDTGEEGKMHVACQLEDGLFKQLLLFAAQR